jgi:cell division protein FtsB
MKFEFHHASRMTKFILIGEFLLVSYLLYALTTHIYNNYQVDYHVENFRKMNEKLEKENRKAAEDLLYYTSDEFIEKMAKQNLNLVNPGEEVIVISDDLLNQPLVEDARASQGDQISKYYHLSNPKKWWKFFFEVDHRPAATKPGSSAAL